MSNWEPTVGTLTAEELAEFDRKWLSICGPCDGGLPMECSHPAEDYRPAMVLLRDHIDALTRQLESARSIAVRLENELAERRQERCPSCEHQTTMHQSDGCWFTVRLGRQDQSAVCPCGRTALHQPEPFGGYNTDPDPDAEVAAMRAQGKA